MDYFSGFSRSFKDDPGTKVKVEITKEFTFEAAHSLPEVGQYHKCRRLHGHLFRVEVTVTGEIDPIMGWVMDFADLASAAKEAMKGLDHHVLNEIPELGNPTSENLARFLYERLSRQIEGVSAVTVHESPTSRCTFRPVTPVLTSEEIELAVRGLVFSAAHFLVFNNGQRETVHGHDYRMDVLAKTPAGRNIESREALENAARRAISEIEHHIVIAGACPVAPCAVDGESIVMELPGGRVVLPSADCVVFDIQNTSTEAIAGVLANKISNDIKNTGLGIPWVEVRLTEGLDAVGAARVEVA